MNNEQQAFLEKLALRIPQLFEVIRQGNIKSEYIIGVRRIGQRHVRLKMVVEVVDAGANPLDEVEQANQFDTHIRCIPRLRIGNTNATKNPSPTKRRRERLDRNSHSQQTYVSGHANGINASMQNSRSVTIHEGPSDI